MTYSNYAKSLVDPSYLDQLTGKTTKERPKESNIGDFHQISITALESSVVPTFDALMPKPEIFENKKTGLFVRKYRNVKG